MITHPGRDVLLAQVDGELEERHEADVTGHVAACATCRASASELRSSAVLFASALNVMDASEPALWSSIDRAGRDVAADDVPEAAPRSTSAPSATLSSLSSSAAAASGRRNALRWAAGILLFASAATSAALIGTRATPGPGAAAPPDAAPPTAERSVAAVLVTPHDGTLVVALTGAGDGSRVHVTLADRASANVAVEGVESPRFTAVAGRVDVDLRGDIAGVRLELPRDVREATVTLGGASLITVRAGVITPAAAATAGIPTGSASRPRME